MKNLDPVIDEMIHDREAYEQREVFCCDVCGEEIDSTKAESMIELSGKFHKLCVCEGCITKNRRWFV